MKKKLMRSIVLITVISTVSAISSCGTILYPERRGQQAGRLDAAVAVMDGLGLLLFLVPGVVAFAVDFATGAIYLPPGHAKLELDPAGLKNAHITAVDKASLSRHEIETLLERELGQRISLASSEIKVARVLHGVNPEWVSIDELLTPQQLLAFKGE